FQSGYSYVTPAIFSQAQYTITVASNIDASQLYGPNSWTSVTTDPLGVNGNVLLLDGATTPNTSFWSQNITVTQNTAYVFSFYGVDVNNNRSSDAIIQASINGAPGTVLNTNGSWQQDVFLWYSGSNTSASISLTDLNTSLGANDFAVDK